MYMWKFQKGLQVLGLFEKRHENQKLPNQGPSFLKSLQLRTAK